jgi:hypothetical protein
VRLEKFTEARISRHVLGRRSLAVTPKPAHAIADVGEKTLARLLAIVADIDAALQLALDGAPRRLSYNCLKGRCIYLLVAIDAQLQVHEGLGTRQAPGVGGQDPRLASLH